MNKMLSLLIALLGLIGTSVNQLNAQAPAAVAFAIQPSCDSDGNIAADGYLQLSEVTGGLSYSIDDGTGFGPVVDLTGATFPLQILTGLANPATDQNYTIRIYEDAAGTSANFTDVIVTLEVQDCSAGCECNDFLYLNDTGLNFIEKFRVNSDGTLTEIGDSQNGQPWVNAGMVGLENPHGVGGDLNGFLFIGSTDNDYIRRVTCDGDVVDNDPSTPAFDNLMNDGTAFNHFTVGNLLYGQINNNGNAYNSLGEVRIYDLCTGAIVGCQESFENNFMQFWGFINGNDGYWYGTGFAASNAGNISTEGIWRGLIDPSAFDDGSGGCGSIELYRSMADLGLDSPTQRLMGITFDDMGNLYTVVADDSGFNPPSFLLKLTPGGTITTSLIDNTVENNPADNLNWAGARGIVWSQSTNNLYVSSGDDCIAAFNTDLVYQPSSSVHIQGVLPKGIGIVTECCPNNNNQTVEIVRCNSSASEAIFLNEIYNCEGTVCEAQWEPADAASMAIYDDCNQTIVAGTATGCYTFTRSSDGTGTNNQCGAFVQTLIVEINEVQASVIAGNQDICNGEDPAAFTVTSAATGTGALSFQWSVSTESATTGFTDIPGATSEGYDPTPADITANIVYFRLIVSVAGCASTACADTSNTVLVVTVTDPAATLTPTASSCIGTVEGDNGTITWDSSTDATHYGISSPNAGAYDGPMTAGTAIAAPADGTVILNNIDHAGATYIIRIFNGAADCFVDLTIVVPAGPDCNPCINPTVTVASPFTICSSRFIDLTQDASISPASLGGSWSTPDGDGVFTTGTDYATATTYEPSASDINRGFVTLVLTTNDPAGICSQESASVIVNILRDDCGSFPWDGN